MPLKSKVKSDPKLRGSALILGSKVWFIVASYGIYFGLSRLLGVEDFGRYGLVVGAVTVINMCFIKGTLQAVSKFVSEDPSRADAVKFGALKIQLGIGGGSFIIFFAAAGYIARLLNAPELAPYLRIAAFIILFYSFYAVFIGVLNGRREFTQQALFDISYSTLKVTLILILSFFFLLKGAIVGFAGAAGLVLAGAALFVGIKKPGETYPTGKILRFCLPVMTLTFVLYLSMHLDLFMLKRLAPVGEAARYAGWYTAALTFARLPFMLVVSALALVLFPFVSRATFVEDTEKTKHYIRQGMRLTYLIMMIGTVLIASSPRVTMGLIYQTKFSGGAPALAWICGGYLFFSLFMMALTIISGSGKPSHSLLLTLIVIVVQFIALSILIRAGYGIRGAAWGSSLAFITGAAASGIYLSRRLGAFMNLRSFLRITGAGLVTFFISRLLPVDGVVGLLVKDLFLIVIFGVILILTKEVGKTDRDMLLATLPFKKSAKDSGVKSA